MSAMTVQDGLVTTAPDTCGVNIRGVPKAVWRRARANALQSGLPFKVYVIKLLERSEPLPPNPPKEVEPKSA